MNTQTAILLILIALVVGFIAEAIMGDVFDWYYKRKTRREREAWAKKARQMKSTITIHLDDEQLAKAERQADEAGWTVAQWVEWVVYEYQPPDDIAPEYPRSESP